MNFLTLIACLQFLMGEAPTQEELRKIIGLKQSTMSSRANRNGKIKPDEIELLNKHYNIDLMATKKEVAQSMKKDKGIDFNKAIQYYPDVYLSAGFGVEVLDEKFEYVTIDEKFLISEKGMRVNPKNCKMVRVSGNSMYPEYHHGDRVIIDASDTNLTDGQIYAFRYDGQCYMKEINRAGNKIKCISINKEYEPFTIERDTDFQVFGRILPRIRL